MKFSLPALREGKINGYTDPDHRYAYFFLLICTLAKTHVIADKTAGKSQKISLFFSDTIIPITDRHNSPAATT
jgi:hypothetical protein